MKKIYFLLIAFAPIMGKAQTFKPDSNTKKIEQRLPYYLIDTVVQSALTKTQLYSNCLGYIANSFNDSRAVIELKDSDIGEIIFSGNTYRIVTENLSKKKNKVENVDFKMRLFFKCKLFLKDNKFKVIIFSLEYPFTELLDTGVNLPVQPSSPDEKDNNKIARELAFDLIKDISGKINKKPENDF